MKRVLIVDDDPQFVSTLEVLLDVKGYGVLTARDGLEALDLLSDPRQPKPDIVVADVMMPQCDGLELCRRVRQYPEFELLPFIFLSARTLLEDRVAGLRVGADDYLTKPFDPEELIIRIENLLERVRRIHSTMVRITGSQSLAPVPEPTPEPTAGLAYAPLSNDSPIAPLSATEREVFYWVAHGLTNREIADRMYLSIRTVQGHVTNIRAKLNLAHRQAILRFAYEHRLV